MTIATSEEQNAVRYAIADWAQSVRVTECVRADLDKPRDQWTDLFAQVADFGLFGAAVADDRGGLGAHFADVAAMLEQCGTNLVPGPLIPTVAAAIALGRSDHARAPEVLDGLVVGRYAAVTPACAFAGGAAHYSGDVLDLGLVAGFIEGSAVVAPVDTGAPGGARRWWIVPPGAGVAEVVPQAPLDGTASVARVGIRDLSADDVIELGVIEPGASEPGGEGELIAGVLSAGLAAYQSGVARWCLTTAVDYAKIRTQFGVAIGSFQAIKHICAEMLCRSERITAVAWDLARAVDSAIGADASDEDYAQLTISRLAADAVVAVAPIANAKDCIQILGGIGFTFEHDAHLYLRSALAAQIVLGHGDRQRAALATIGLAGGRRRFTLDLSEVEHRRAQVRAAAAEIAAANPAEQRQLLAESGYLTPHWPPPYGLGADAALQLLIDAEFENAEVHRPDLVIAGWAIPTILEHGTAEQRDRFVGPTLAGEIVWCQLFSEPEAGSDLAALRTRAERVAGGWRLNGQKIWTSQAHNAQWAICLARTDPDAPKHKGITYFLVDMASPGIDIRPLRELTGRANFNEVFLDDVVVPDDCVVGDVNGGWRLARTTLANERVAMGGSGLGKEMETLLAQITERGEPLTDALLAELGELVADAHVGRVLDARAVTQQLAGHDPGALSSVRKLIGVEHRQSVPELALALLGVEGLAASEASDLVLQNRCLSIAGGTTQILRTAAAERILGLPRG